MEPGLTKACSKCKTVKPIERFYLRMDRPGGRTSQCAACLMEANRTPEGKARMRSNSLRWKYGIDGDQWDALFESQGRRCALCGTGDPKAKQGWCTDHDHKAGTVRSILCHWCNLGLGYYELGWQMPDRATIERYLGR